MAVSCASACAECSLDARDYNCDYDKKHNGKGDIPYAPGSEEYVAGRQPCRIAS
jgi:hypothetical protein